VVSSTPAYTESEAKGSTDIPRRVDFGQPDEDQGAALSQHSENGGHCKAAGQAGVDHRRVLTAPAAAQDREVEEMMDGPGTRMKRAWDEMIQYCDTVFPSLMARRKRILDVFIPAFNAWRAETLGALARCKK